MLTQLRARRGPERGVTLIELLIAMIIMAVISTMLVGGWISLQRSYAFARAANTARGTARDALDRISSELRASQPPNLVKTTPITTPFYFGGVSPYVCDAYHCVFYSAYNNSATADGTGLGQVRLTAIWLDTSGTTAQKTLWWQRDTNNNGLDAGDRKIKLATNVVNTAASVNKPIFIYNYRDSTTGTFTNSFDPPATPLTSTSVVNLRSVRIELVIDANLAHTPTYIDLTTTVRPRNSGPTE